MAEATTTSATATIIQAAEHVVIEEATTAVKTITSKNAAEIKSIINGVAKETVAATDDGASTILENIEDGVKVIGSEIVEGAEAVVEAVEKHPELIAEGALALGVGVASIVQPELIVGSVALVGKMAADATKDTINQIVVESGTEVVKGVSKEVADETAGLAAQDAAEKAKKAALDLANDGTKSGVEATMDVKSSGIVKTKVIALDGSKEGEEAGQEVFTTVSGDATATIRKVTSGDAPGPIISKETVQTSATATSKTKGDYPAVTKSSPTVVVTKNNLTGETRAAVQQDSTTAVATSSPEIAKATDFKDGAVSVSSVDVKALAKEVAREMNELEAAKSSQSGEKTLETIQSTSEAASNKPLKDAASKLESDLKDSAAKANEKPSGTSIHVEAETSEMVTLIEKPEIFEAKAMERGEILEEGSKPEETTEDSKTPSDVEKARILAQLGIVHSVSPTILEVNEEGTIPKSETNPPPTISPPRTDHSEDLAPREDEKAKDTVPPKPVEKNSSTTSNQEPEAKARSAPSKAAESSVAFPPLNSISDSTPAIPQPEPEQGSHAATRAAVKEAHEKIDKLHESNQLLHKKLDTMQEALLAITKALSERPAPSPASTPAIQPAPVPEADAELLITENNQLVLTSASPPPITEAVAKRMSVFGSIGWLFGAGSGPGSGTAAKVKGHKRGKSVATSTPASVPDLGGEAVLDAA